MHDPIRTGPVISVRGLVKTYDQRRVVDHLDLDIDAGEIFSLLGPNGAGKTTTVEILEGHRRRDHGHVEVLGHDPAHGDAAWRARIGVVLQTSSAFDRLTPNETVEHFADLFPGSLPPSEAIDLVGLRDAADRRTHDLSGGQRRRLDIACGIVGRPEVLFLDEPTTGLDPQARRQVWTLIERLRSFGTTIVLTTHYLDEAEALSDRVGVIVGGRLVDVGHPDHVGGRSSAAAVVHFRLTDELAAAGPVPADPTCLDVTPSGARADGRRDVAIQTERPTATVARLRDWAGVVGVEELPELRVVRPSLEDVYLRMVERDDEEVAR